MITLGLNSFHANSSACLFRDEQLIFAIEEERLSRIKNTHLFPSKSIKKILQNENLNINAVDNICVNFNPSSSLIKKILYTLKNPKKTLMFKSKLVESKKSRIFYELSKIGLNDKSKIKFVDHHYSHQLYALSTSNFDNALCISIDGFGDFKSTTINIFQDGKFKNIENTYFPHSLGIFYQAFCQIIGFFDHGEEYKMMGMSAFGKNYIPEIDDVIKIKGNLFELELKYFNHHKEDTMSLLENGKVSYKKLYSNILYETFKNYSREDIAFSVQQKYEEILFNIINKFSQNNLQNLCLSGGCALNSLANGKIYQNTNIKSLHTHSCPYDAGGAVGAALSYINKSFKTDFEISPYLGTSFSDEEIEIYLNKFKDIKIKKFNNSNLLIREAAMSLSKGKVIGWFQGKMEWGARALGNRSILANPIFKDIKDIVNRKIKKRESFRPFAPSILERYAEKYFYYHEKDPYMSRVYKFRSEVIENIPSVVHVDKTGRLQTINEKLNKKFNDLIEEFFQITNVPILLNTSFNENEPIVNLPSEAVSCFLRNDLDELYISNFKIIKNKN